MPLVLGVDTGGTFTDLVALCPERGFVTLKLPSTPDDPARAVLEGVERLTKGTPAKQINHATTVATNALLERTGGTVAFITSNGFRDLLRLGRGDRTDLYSLSPSRIEAPVPDSLCFEIAERVLATGEIHEALRSDKIAALINALPDDLDAVAITLLHSSVAPDHELALARELERAGLRAFASHRVAPGSGEYERAMTTVLAAYLSPKVEGYLARLESSLTVHHLRIVHSAGGLLTVGEARSAPHRLALSGPAAGLRGAHQIGRRCRRPNLVTLDMGGTSSDTALIAEDALPYSWEATIDGYPVRAPTLSIHTVGAGGGSIAWTEGSGLLRVGPHSSGAVPGPACYGRGGSLPTVTDALCWNGFLPPVLGDESLTLDRQAAGRALDTVAEQLNLTTEEVADGVLSVAASHLAEAVRKVTTGSGHDPGRFTLFPFGGAGPLLACQVAEYLEMSSILVPARSGTLSAWGALIAPWEQEWSAPIPVAHRLETQKSRDLLAHLEKEKQKAFDSGDEIEWQHLVARHYTGQGETLVSEPWQDFHDLHQRRFGFVRPSHPIETVEVRLRARRAPLTSPPSPPLSSVSEPLATTSLRWREERLTTPVFDFEKAPPLTGPALLLQSGSTLFVAPGWSTERSTDGHLHLERTR